MVAQILIRRVRIRRAGRVLGPLVAAALILGGATPALAAKPAHKAAHHTAAHARPRPGYDVSHPQCGSRLPRRAAFAIVGLNGGRANTLNPCFGPSGSYPRYSQSQLYWALVSTRRRGGRSRAALYVNTGDPGNVHNGKRVASWPKSGRTPYGPCRTTSVSLGRHRQVVGRNSTACAWRYGHDRAAQDVVWLARASRKLNRQQHRVVAPRSASAYTWWLDVETGNTWRSNRRMNVAVLQGMVAGLRDAGARSVGIYSTTVQWRDITGGSRAGSLRGLRTWVPGAVTRSGARANCRQRSFTGGRVVLTQWVGRLDGDYAC